MKILNGYHIERITQGGQIEILRRSLNFKELIVISIAERLPVIIPTTENQKVKAALMASKILGNNYYRYSMRRIIGPKYLYLILLPRNYTYTNYFFLTPKSTTHYRKISYTGNFAYVKSSRLERRFHVGPCIGLFSNPWENSSCFSLYYINPNDTEVDLRICLDIAPFDEKSLQSLFQIYGALGASRKEIGLIQQTINKAYRDLKDSKIRKVKEHVDSLRASDTLLYLMVKNTRVLLRKLKRLGLEIKSAGKHQYKAKNPKTGNTAPISWRREFKPYYIRKLCDELQIDYNRLLEDP